mgnify:CR=1 FL=1
MENSNKKEIRYFDSQSGAYQARQMPIYDVQQLFGDTREVRLRHCSEEYRLILTKNNKLILTK